MLLYSNTNFWSLDLNKTLKIASLMLYFGYWKKEYPNLCINSYISKLVVLINKITDGFDNNINKYFNSLLLTNVSVKLKAG